MQEPITRLPTGLCASASHVNDAAPTSSARPRSFYAMRSQLPVGTFRSGNSLLFASAYYRLGRAPGVSRICDSAAQLLVCSWRCRPALFRIPGQISRLSDTFSLSLLLSRPCTRALKAEQRRSEASAASGPVATAAVEIRSSAEARRGASGSCARGERA